MRLATHAVATIAVLAMTAGCSEYYEYRIDRLYAQCGLGELSEERLNDCAIRVTRLQATYPSPRLDALRKQLELQAGAGPYAEGGKNDEFVESSPQEVAPGYDEGITGEGDYGGPLTDPSLMDQGDDYSASDEQLEPLPDPVPPSEPQEPMDPDER